MPTASGIDGQVMYANETVYGLGGAVWSNDRARAERVARRIRTGQVHVNGAPFNPAAPLPSKVQFMNRTNWLVRVLQS
jgi:acyl-CoA reductase-like NAD-dependent aldehyde dehydrogenase